MNRVACIFVAVGLAAAGSTALAAQPANPELMTDAQMDNVTGGGVVDVIVTNALNDWKISLDLKLQANVVANVNAGVALVGTAQATQGIVSQLQVTGNVM